MIPAYLSLPQFPAMSERRRAIAEIGARYLEQLAEDVAEQEKNR